VVDPSQLPQQFRQAIVDSFPGSGDKTVQMQEGTWMTITDGMAATTTTGTAAAAHLEGVDFAGKTGTAQVVGGGDTHVKGGDKTPNAWFVGMIPRRNPEVAFVVLQEHGDWGAGSAMIAQKIAIEYVNKERLKEHNVIEQASTPKPVEMGAVWNEPGPADPRHPNAAPQDALRSGRFVINPQPAPPVEAKFTATSLLPAWLEVAPLRFKNEEEAH
jgi:penicillin-binding protein 2